MARSVSIRQECAVKHYCNVEKLHKSLPDDAVYGLY
jgi:hypothetical protein